MRLRIRDDDLRFDRHRPLCRGDLWVGSVMASRTLDGLDWYGTWVDRRAYWSAILPNLVPFRNRIRRVPGSAPRSTP